MLKKNVALYGFGDASGSGFFQAMGNASGIYFSHGLWDPDEESSSFNHRELANLVETLDDGLQISQLTNT